MCESQQPKHVHSMTGGGGRRRVQMYMCKPVQGLDVTSQQAKHTCSMTLLLLCRDRILC